MTEEKRKEALQKVKKMCEIYGETYRLMRELDRRLMNLKVEMDMVFNRLNNDL